MSYKFEVALIEENITIGESIFYETEADAIEEKDYLNTRLGKMDKAKGLHYEVIEND